MLLAVTTWESVADAVRARLDELTMSQRDLAKKADVSVDTVRKIVNSEQESYRRLTLSSVSRALDWPGDTLQRISDGEDPFADGDPISASGLTDPADRGVIDRLDRIEDILKRMSRHQGGGASGERGGG